MSQGDSNPAVEMDAWATVDGDIPLHTPFVVAEISGNHGGSLSNALSLVEAAKEAGADAVKLQTFEPGRITLDVRNEHFQVKGSRWDGANLHDLYSETQTPWDWHAPIFARIRELGMVPFSSAFHPEAVDFLETLNCPLYKIASPEIVDFGLIERIGMTGKPVIMSTGMASQAEVSEAVDVLRATGCRRYALLHCVSSYPTDERDANLKSIAKLKELFGCPVGFSDHSLGATLPGWAVVAGAVIIEKHFILDRNMGGQDAAFSLEPREFAEMVRQIDLAQTALGQAVVTTLDSEQALRLNRRSLFAVCDIASGEAFSAANVRSVRPSAGLHTRHYREVLGARAARAITRGEPLDWSMVEKS